MDKIERIKKQFEQGNRWVEGNTDDIKQALRELGYRLSPKSEELPTLKDVFPAGGVPDEWAKAIEYYRAYLIGCGITQAKRLPSDKRESVAKKLAMIHLGKDWEDLDEEERALYLGDADEVIPLISPPMEVLSKWADIPTERGEYWVSPFVEGRYISPRILLVFNYERPDRGLEVHYDFPRNTVPVKTFVREYYPKAKWLLIKEPEPPAQLDRQKEV